LAGVAFLKSKAAHTLAVNGVAGGLRLKNDTVKKIETIREEAQDIYEEARRKDCDCGCGGTGDTGRLADGGKESN
jgi:hypothetical protein